MYKCYVCNNCGNEFLVLETIPSNCPFCLSKTELERDGVYSNLIDCMQARKYVKVKGRVSSR